jgi:hypothetical protein
MTSTTDIPAAKVPRDQRQDTCLHCVVMTAIEGYFRQHGERAPDGQVVIDVTMVVQKLAECTVEMTEMTRDRSQRRRAFRFAHDALDAQLKSARSGKLVEVEIPSEH